MKQTDFLIKRAQIVDKLEKWRIEYEEFLKEVSVKHWRSAGHFNSVVKENLDNIQTFTQMTNVEKNIDWVKESIK